MFDHKFAYMPLYTTHYTHSYVFINSFDRRWSRLVSLSLSPAGAKEFCIIFLLLMCTILWPLSPCFRRWLFFWPSLERFLHHNSVVCPLESIYNQNIFGFHASKYYRDASCQYLFQCVCVCVYAQFVCKQNSICIICTRFAVTIDFPVSNSV